MTACGAVARPSLASAESVAPLSLIRAREASRALENWMMSEEAKNLSLTAVELEQDKRSREAQRLLLQAHLEARGTGDVGPAVELGGLGGEDESPQVLTERRIHPRQMNTIFGKVKVNRLGYGGTSATSVHPLDEKLALPKRSFTQEVQRRLLRGAIQGPFDEAVERVQESTGLIMPKRTAELIVREAAVDFDTFYAQRVAPDAAMTGPILVCAADCKGIPMVKPEKALRSPRRKKGQKPHKKRMATVAAVFTQTPYPRTADEIVERLFYEGPTPMDPPRASTTRSKPEHKRVWASVEKSKDDVLDEIVAEMHRRDPEGQKRWVGVIDGERALQHRITKRLPSLTLVLDIIHALDYLWEAAYCFHPEGTPEAKAWVKERALRLLRGEVSQVVKGIRQSASKRRLKATKKETIRIVTGYFMRNRKRMRYHEYLRDGLPIASGAVEGACKHLVKDRMERSGMRWTIAGAEALLRLRATYLSADLNEYLEFHTMMEQERLHPTGSWRAVEK